MEKELARPEVQELIRQNDWRKLKEIMVGWEAPDIADLLEELEQENMIIVFRFLPRQLATDVFGEIDPDEQMNIIQQISNEHIRDIVSELSPDDRTELFEELPGKITQRLLNLLPRDDCKEARQLLGYPDESVGRLMTPEYVAIRPQWSIEKSLKHIREFGKDAETINMVYVVDNEWHLLDDVTLRRLILANPEQKVESIMDRKFISISAFEDQEEAAETIKHYDLVALPVLDSEDVLLGIVTVDDIIDVIEDEVTEDVQKGASVAPLEMSYTAASVFTLYKKRVIWLSLLAVSGFLSANIIFLYEGTIAKVVALSFFIPVLIGSGGNTGSQSSALIIRAIATGDLTLKRWFDVVKKELFVGLLLGITLGAILYSGSHFWEGGAEIALVVGISVAAIVLWANLLGSTLPIAITKLRLDPAFVSSPLVATIIDVTGLGIYFSLARVLLKL